MLGLYKNKQSSRSDKVFFWKRFFILFVDSKLGSLMEMFAIFEYNVFNSIIQAGI